MVSKKEIENKKELSLLIIASLSASQKQKEKRLAWVPSIRDPRRESRQVHWFRSLHLRQADPPC
jgi:hypothetical protein